MQPANRNRVWAVIGVGAFALFGVLAVKPRLDRTPVAPPAPSPPMAAAKPQVTLRIKPAAPAEPAMPMERPGVTNPSSAQKTLPPPPEPAQPDSAPKPVPNRPPSRKVVVKHGRGGKTPLAHLLPVNEGTPLRPAVKAVEPEGKRAAKHPLAARQPTTDDSTRGDSPEAINSPEPEAAAALPVPQTAKPKPTVMPGSTVAATGTAGPQAPAPSTEQAAEKLFAGHFAVRADPEMTLGQSVHVRATAGRAILQKLVDAELVAGETPTTTSATTATIARDMKLAELLRVELRPDSEADFEIRPLTQAEQTLTNEDVAVWEWAVTPKQEGQKNLTVLLTNLVDGSQKAGRVKLQRITILVNVSTSQRIKEIAVAGSSALSGLAGLIGTWLGILRPLLQRRKEGEDQQAAGGRPPRGAGDGGPPPGPGHPPGRPHPSPTHPAPAATAAAAPNAVAQAAAASDPKASG
jgi:hypothetical protein